MHRADRERVSSLGGRTMTPKRLAILRETVKKAQAALKQKRAAAAAAKLTNPLD